MCKETKYALSDNIRDFLLTQFSPNIATRALLEESDRLVKCCQQFDDLSLSPTVARIALSNRDFADFFNNNNSTIAAPFAERKEQISSILFSLGWALGNLREMLPYSYQAIESKYLKKNTENYSIYQVRKGIEYMSEILWGYTDSINNMRHYVSSTHFDRFFDSGDLKFHNSKMLLKNLLTLSSSMNIFTELHIPLDIQKRLGLNLINNDIERSNYEREKKYFFQMAQVYIALSMLERYDFASFTLLINKLVYNTSKNVCNNAYISMNRALQNFSIFLWGMGSVEKERLLIINELLNMNLKESEDPADEKDK